MELITGVWKRIARCFVAGVLAILPIVVTVAIVIWVADLTKGFLGPDTMLGRFLSSIGGNFFRAEVAPYAAGWVVVLGVVFAVGVLVELGAKSIVQRLVDSLFKRIPLIGSIYTASKQVVEMIDKKDDDALQGMSAVFCFFGKDSSTGVLAFLASPEKFWFNGQAYHIVIVPTAPLPFGGAMLFVPETQVKSAGYVGGWVDEYLPIDGCCRA